MTDFFIAALGAVCGWHIAALLQRRPLQPWEARVACALTVALSAVLAYLLEDMP